MNFLKNLKKIKKNIFWPKTVLAKKSFFLKGSPLLLRIFSTQKNLLKKYWKNLILIFFNLRIFLKFCKNFTKNDFKDLVSFFKKSKILILLWYIKNINKIRKIQKMIKNNFFKKMIKNIKNNFLKKILKFQIFLKFSIFWKIQILSKT